MTTDQIRYHRLVDMPDSGESSSRMAGISISKPQDTKSDARVLAQTSSGTSGNHTEFLDGFGDQGDSAAGGPYRVYRGRFFGLLQLVLLNIVISWDWLTFAAVSTTSGQFYNVSQTAINWLSTGFLFAFLVSSPVTIWILNRYGPKYSILAASLLTLVGNWIRYAGTRAAHTSFATVVVGQIVIGLAQPFVLAAPTRYSNLWFSDSGRVSATALASLANPLGGALGQLVGPFWATEPSQIPDMVLYTAIISSIVTLPAVFLPAAPPTPPSAIAAAENLSLTQAFRELPRNGSFWLIFIPFTVLVGLFNAVSSLLNQILEPFSFSETDAGIAGAVLIVVGLVAAAITSPIIDRTRAYLTTVKILIPFAAIAYLILIFMPPTHSDAAVFVVCGLIGATSFSLLPCALELLALVTHPVPPEVSSVFAWAGGQLLGGVFILIMTALQSNSGWSGQPPGTMTRALIFQAVLACVVVPFPLFLGTFGFRRVSF